MDIDLDMVIEAKFKSATEMLDEANRIASRLIACNFVEYEDKYNEFLALPSLMYHLVCRRLSDRGRSYMIPNYRQ